MLLLGLLDVPWWLLLLTAFTLLIWYSWPDANHFRSQGISCSRAYPIIGTMYEFFSLPTTFLDEYVPKEHSNDRCMGGFIGTIPMLSILDPDMVSEICVKQFAAFSNRMSFKTGSRMTDNMLLSLEDVHWKHVRNGMTPTFTSGKLKQMNGEINRCSQILAESLLEQAERGGEVEMREFTGGFSMDVIASTAFGIRVNSQKDRNNQFVEHARRAFINPRTSPLILLFLLFPRLGKMLVDWGLSVSYFPKDTLDFFENITRQAIDIRKSDQDQSRADFIQLMIKAQRGEHIGKDDEGPEQERTEGTGLTTDEILANAMLFFVAGYDTTATSLSCFMYSMARYPDIQDKLMDEINTVVGDKEEVDTNMIQDMPYLDQCVNENLRMYPPAIIMNRVAKYDTTVKGISIKKGTMINLHFYDIHHDPRKWPEPYEFNPDRFSPENKRDRNPYHFLPFGHGPRNCIGMRLALQELKVAIVHVLRKVKLTKSENTKIPLVFEFNPTILRIKDGIFLKVEPREGK